ncbi:recombinase family protein [Paraburkholderia fungorum]|uniref:recombinase family protein n=1 Tax=Paraburkholderia fungorum TaxID=134537 RepID=UPI0019105B04
MTSDLNLPSSRIVMVIMRIAAIAASSAQGPTLGKRALPGPYNLAVTRAPREIRFYVKRIALMVFSFARVSTTFTYCRVSTADQAIENQIREIEAAGFAIDRRRMTSEAISGSVAAKDHHALARQGGHLS